MLVASEPDIRSAIERHYGPEAAPSLAPGRGPIVANEMAWEPTEEAWQYVLLDKLPPGLDLAQLDRSLRMTLTERLESVRKMSELADELRRSRDGLQKTR